MRKDENIKYSQLVLLVSAATVYPFLLISGSQLSQIGVVSLSVLAAYFAAVCILTYALSNRRIDETRGSKGIFAVKLLITLYLLITAVRLLTIFASFFKSAVSPKSEEWFTALAILLCCCYAACKGISGLSASSILLSILGIIAVLILLLAAVPNASADNFYSIESTGDSPADSLIGALSFSVFVPLILIFNRNTAKRLKSGYCIPITFTAVLVLFGVLCAFCLGNYSKAVLYPLLALSRLPALNILESVSGIWFLVIALLCLISVAACLAGIVGLWNMQSKRLLIWFTGGIVFAGVLLFGMLGITADNRVLMCVCGILSVLTAVLSVMASRRTKPDAL